ncbi:SRPBCC domain-containing protein [uncultured Aquimarina sp.]|uniref:SRPBCC family protein n=1 Tax=uncultured Aquimarina sp. TaxID=575652 RepID=UPI002637B30C|nr:SRPBCC domain-containing protein [uncultured Aquimarina sp.]
MKVTDDPIIIEEYYNASEEKVWRAITGVKEMKFWFFEAIKSFKAEVGFKTQFLVQVEDRNYTHCWEVTEVIPIKKITYTWSYIEYPGDAFVTFELFKTDHQTRLKLSLTVTEDFPSDIPEFTRESCIAGWNYFLGQRLKEYLAE